jgi:hypothetical protein
MQRLTTLTTTIGTITAITCLAPLATFAATPNPEPIVGEATQAAPTAVPLAQLPKEKLAATPAIAAPESMAQMDSSTQVWTIETTPVQPRPTQTMVVPVTAATKPVWTEGSMRSNADVATSDLPLTTEIGSIAPLPNDVANAEMTAQLPPEAEAAALQDVINSYRPAPNRWLKRYKASPGITMGNPSGFGADRGKVFTGLGISRTPLRTLDGSAGIGIGIGNARKSIGVQLSYTAYSLTSNTNGNSNSRNAGDGAFNIKIHRQFANGWSVALGADSIINVGKKLSFDPFNRFVYNESEGTYYGVVTKMIPLKSDPTDSFSRLALTLGAGTGRFQSEGSLMTGKYVITPFASAALTISPAASLTAEWSGHDFGIGLSWVPFRNLPIVISPGVRDLFGVDIGKPRWQLGIGLSL